MLGKVVKIYRKESFRGVWNRVRKHLYNIKFKLWKHIGFREIKTRYGVKLAANYTDTTFWFYVIGLYGDFYWDHLSNLNSPFIFIDIGANQGLYTICAAKNGNCIQSYSFEPVSKTHDLLEKNIQLNNLADKCSLFKKAISNKTGQAEIFVKTNHSGAASMHKDNGLITKSGDSEIIELVSSYELNTLINNQNELPVIIKLDVEGFEKTVLVELMKSSLADSISEIYYEVDEAWVDPYEIENFLRGYGFIEFTKHGEDKHYDILASK